MKRIGAVIFPGFELLDMYGPMEMFGLLRDAFQISMVAQDAGPVPSGQGPSAAIDETFDSHDPFDLILVPGGPGTRKEVDNPVLTGWLADQARQVDLVLGVCTGAALLARAGVLDGRRATTNKAAFSWVQSQGARVDWVKQARWVHDGEIFTSSGVSAGIDMSLAVIAHLLDPDTAEKVAVAAEYDWHKDPDWDPFAAIHGLV